MLIFWFFGQIQSYAWITTMNMFYMKTTTTPNSFKLWISSFFHTMNKLLTYLYFSFEPSNMPITVDKKVKKYNIYTVCWTLTLTVTSRSSTPWPPLRVLVVVTPTWSVRRLMSTWTREPVNWPKKNWKELFKSCKTQLNTRSQLGSWTVKETLLTVRTTTLWLTKSNPSWETIWKD